MTNWIDDIHRWDGKLPATLLSVGLTPERQGARLRAFVACALDLDPEDIVIERVKGRAPVLVEPKDRGLYLSTSHRRQIAAMAVARSQVGVDVEIVDAPNEIPWNVLHPSEAAMLIRVDETARARSFARLWSLKEAYLKALGLGLSREPASFAIHFLDNETAAVEDRSGPQERIDARTIWREVDGAPVAISTVVIERRAGSAGNDDGGA